MNLQTIIVMPRISFTPLALLLAALTLAACKSVDIEAAVQRSTHIDSEALPADVRLATAAVAMTMKGYGPGEVQGVAFADGAPNACKFVGHLVFQDVGNRRIIVGFVATYSVEADRIIVWEATTGTVTPDRPTVSWFLVPAAKVPAGLSTKTVTPIFCNSPPKMDWGLSRQRSCRPPPNTMWSGSPWIGSQPVTRSNFSRQPPAKPPWRSSQSTLTAGSWEPPSARSPPPIWV
jgi:hypothetical protein